MSIYLEELRSWKSGVFEELTHVEYKVLGEMRKDILDRLQRDWEDASNEVKMVRTSGDLNKITLTVRRFGEEDRLAYIQDTGFEDPKDSQAAFFEWIHEEVAN